MKKILEAIKGIFAWVGAVVIGLLMIKRNTALRQAQDSFDYKSMSKLSDDEIEEKCNEKRKETVARIGACSARDVTESYGGACDAIHEGIERFKRRID